jgi:hypothetical protein
MLPDLIISGIEINPGLFDSDISSSSSSELDNISAVNEFLNNTFISLFSFISNHIHSTLHEDQV